MVWHPYPLDRLTVVEWAKNLLQQPFYVFDTETTGVKEKDQVIQIGVIDQDGKTVLDTLVRPTRRVPSDAIQVHGITNEQLRQQPSFDEIFDQVKPLFNQTNVLAYNIAFDLRLLTQTAELFDLTLPIPRSEHCAMLQYATFYGAWDDRRKSYKWHKLTNACFNEGVTVRDAHSAVGDCLMTLDLLHVMAQS